MLRRFLTLGCLGSLVTVLAVIAGLLVAGDVAARRYATGQLNDRISASTPGASGVHSRIRSFPFLGRLLVNGDIAEVGTHVDQLIVAAGITFTNLDVDLRRVDLDRHAALFDRQVQLKRVGRGTASVELTAPALSSALGRPVRVSGGTIIVSVLGSSGVRATVAVSASQRLEVRVSGLPVLSIQLPSAKLLPCTPQVTVVAAGVELACTFTSIPPAFVRAIAGAPA